MARYRISVYVGPSLVRHWARRFKRTPGVKVVSTGTERVTVDVSASRANGCGGAKHNLSAALFRKYGSDHNVLRWGVACERRAR